MLEAEVHGLTDHDGRPGSVAGRRNSGIDGRKNHDGRDGDGAPPATPGTNETLTKVGE